MTRPAHTRSADTARPLHPSRAAGHNSFLAWSLTGTGIVVLAVATAVWLAGGLLSWQAKGVWPETGWSIELPVIAASGSKPWPWPGASPQAVRMAAAALLACAVVPPGIAVTSRATSRLRSDSPYRSLGQASSVEHLQLPAARRSALRLRSGLKGTEVKRIPPEQAGVALGRVDTGRGAGPMVYASWEDVATFVMAPRSGKTTALAIPAILNAPGPVVATSNKADLLATAPLRAQSTGNQPWVFDPQGVALTPQTWWWDPLAGVESVEDAERLAGHFVSTVEDEKQRDIWGPAATELLSGLVLAAAGCGADLTRVYEWLSDEADPAPTRVLERCGFHVLAASLRSMLSMAPETRTSVYFTARSGARCLRNPQITSWITPKPLPVFDPAAFLKTSRDGQQPTEQGSGQHTLYLLSKDSGGSAAPLVAALTDRVLRAGVRAAEALGGRLDPPLVVVLDEAASVAPIRDLPTLYSHFGSRGILPITILQSIPQGEAVWGANGMKALWSASTVKLVGAGIDEADVAENISRLIGEHDVATVSVNSGERGSRSTSLRTQRILTAAQVRALPKGRALLFATGAPPTMLQLCPYYQGPHATAVAAAAQALEARIKEGANP